MGALRHLEASLGVALWWVRVRAHKDHLYLGNVQKTFSQERILYRDGWSLDVFGGDGVAFRNHPIAPRVDGLNHKHFSFPSPGHLEAEIKMSAEPFEYALFSTGEPLSSVFLVPGTKAILQILCL